LPPFIFIYAKENAAQIMINNKNIKMWEKLLLGGADMV
jgi:hypothetical protein